MLILLQLLTIVFMLGATYLVFRAFGPPRPALLYRGDEKRRWDSLISKPLGSWFALTNVAGTLTSFATVYLFFVGNSKLFGWWIFLCVLTIWGGAFVTNYFTRAILKDSYLRKLLDSPDQRGGVIATVFWRPTRRCQQTAGIVKWLSLLNIAGVIWLEFALFADISSKVLGVGHLAWSAILLGFCCVTVCYFTLRYGLRGFVFADSFQVPLIVLGALVMLGGAVTLYAVNAGTVPSFGRMVAPLLPRRACVLFAFHVLCLNGFLVLVTESHWLRLWIFKQKEITLQVRSLAATAGIWSALILVGLLTSAVANGATGEAAIVGSIGKLSELSAVFPVAFWIGGMAALFSTADVHIYSFLLVNGFDPKTGTLADRRMSGAAPLLSSLLAAAVFCALYVMVRVAALPFEKIVFLIIPLSLNVLPAMVLAARQRIPHPFFVCMSLVLYAACAVLGLIQPTQELAWTLASALMPVVSGLVACGASRWMEVVEEEHERTA